MVQLITIPFTTLTSSSLITLGTVNNSIAIAQSCSLAPLNGPSSSAYAIITYDNSLIEVGSTSICTFVSSNSCKISPISSGAFSMDKISEIIPIHSNITVVSMSATVYSYF